MKDDQVLIAHILESIIRIEEHAQKGKEEFMNNTTLQDATVRNLEIIGEASKNLSHNYKNKRSSIPWKQIAGMRDVIAHEYFGIDLEVIWGVVENRIPELKRVIIEIEKE